MTVFVTVHRAANSPPPKRKRGRVIPTRDFSASCLDGDGCRKRDGTAGCIMPSCQCPCHQAKPKKRTR